MRWMCGKRDRGCWGLIIFYWLRVIMGWRGGGGGGGGEVEECIWVVSDEVERGGVDWWVDDKGVELEVQRMIWSGVLLVVSRKL